MSVDIDIVVKRADRTYSPGETVSGYVLVKTPKPMSHNGLKLIVDGNVSISYSNSKNVSLWEAMVNSMKPIKLMDINVQLAAAGKIPDGSTEIPFEFALKPTGSYPLYETYNGVYLSVKYIISVEMARGFFAKELKKSAEFVVTVPGQGYAEANAAPAASSSSTSVGPNEKQGAPTTSAALAESEGTSKSPAPTESPSTPTGTPKIAAVPTPGSSSLTHPSKKPLSFSMTPSKLKNVKKNFIGYVPQYTIDGSVDSLTCEITQPFMGELIIKNCAVNVKSVELQLVRVESCSVSGSDLIREATEIQNLQVGDGNLCKELAVPVYMVFPRFFTCPTIITPTFRIEFEMNLIILFVDGHQITENFPIYLYRKQNSLK